MSTSVSSFSSVCPPPAAREHVQNATSAPAAKAALATDRIATSQAPAAPLLTIGAAALAQLVPGAVEAEGVLGIATALRIGVGVAMKNPAVGLAVGAAVGGLGHYAASLAHDAFAAEPGYKTLAGAVSGLDAGVRAGLGIPPSGDR